MNASDSTMNSYAMKVSERRPREHWSPASGSSRGSSAWRCSSPHTTSYWSCRRRREAFTRLGFPAASFRVELSWAKVAGVAALLVPMVPARFKEWAYAGFAINLISALIAHLSISDRPAAFVPSTTTSVLWALSYFFWRRLQATPASA